MDGGCVSFFNVDMYIFFMDCDVLIVGAGPAGSSLACKLRSFGLSVVLADKKSVIGKSACSGLFSRRITKFFDIDDGMIENVVEGAIFHTKNCDFEVRKGKSAALVVDRVKFDRFVFKKATDAGAVTLLGAHLLSWLRTDEGIKVYFSTAKGPQEIETKLLVGADGAASTVRRMFGLGGNLKYVNGILSYFPMKDASRLVELYYSPNVAPGFFAWRIPRGKRTEFGLATDMRFNHLGYFKKFLQRFDLKLSRFYAHPICFGNQESSLERVILLGDAAAQVKPFSGGGVIYGLICSDIAAKAVSAAFDEGDFSGGFLRRHYEDKWKGKLMPKIEVGLGIRNTLDSLNDRELDTFFGMLKEQKSAIESFGDMDFL